MLTGQGGFVAAVVVIVMRAGRVLGMRRSPRKDAAPGLWEGVSGRLEPGEQPLEAARREAKEETGLDVWIEPHPVDAYVAERAGLPMLVVCYAAQWRAGEVERSEEHDAHAWLSLEELEALGAPGRLVEAAKRALEMAGFSGQGAYIPPPDTKETTVQLPLQITFRDMESSEAVEQAIREKASKLEEFHDRITSCHVVVETPHRHHHKGRVHHIKIHIFLPGHELTIDREPERGEHEDIYVAIRDAFDAARRQLREFMKKQGAHH